MLRNAHISLTSVGSDPGPYNIFIVDNLNNSTLVASNVPQSVLLTTGYDIIVADNITIIEIISVNPACENSSLELDVPPA